MNFSSNIIINESRINFSIPFETTNISEITFNGCNDITFEYNIEDYAQRLPFNLTELNCFCHLKVRDKSMALSTMVFSDGKHTPKIKPYIEDDGYCEYISIDVDLTSEERDELLIFLLKSAIKK